MHAATVHALDAELKGLAADERRGLVRFLRRLDLLEREQGFELFGCRSAYEYLVKEHHLPEGTAWRRVNAMKLIRRFPELEAALEDGRLNPTQLGVLGPVLTSANVDEVVRAAAHLTKRQTEELAVSIVPRRAPAPGLRVVQSLRSSHAAGDAQAASQVMGLTGVAAAQSVSGARAASPVMGLVDDAPAQAAADASPCEAPIAVAGAAGAGPRAPARITPVARNEWHWRLRIDEARMAKLERLKGLLAHVIPDGDLDRVFDRMLDDTLEVEGKRRGFVEPARRREPASSAPTPGERAPVPRDVRRQVLRRDGYRCTWVHPDGSRCGATSRLEMDHLRPARETGSSGVTDLTTRCRHHNQLRAIRTYGHAYVLERIDGRRRARAAWRSGKPITSGAAQAAGLSARADAVNGCANPSPTSIAT